MNVARKQMKGSVRDGVAWKRVSIQSDGEVEVEVENIVEEDVSEPERLNNRSIRII